MTDVIITGLIGLASSVVSGFSGWFFARRKYNSEVDHNLIENMRSSLEFYKNLSDDNKVRLEEMAVRNNTLEIEIQELRKQVLTLSLNICMDLTCRRRIREYSREFKKNDESKDRFDETQDPGKGGCESSKEG